MSKIYLASLTALFRSARASGERRYPFHMRRLVVETKPSLLISFVFIDEFERARSEYCFRDWALDSGAYSAYKSGIVIDLQQYIETCHRLIKEDGQLAEIFALDVIGDPKASLRNAEKMWEAGIAAIPTYHHADQDPAFLDHIAKNYPKIAVGGMAHLRGTTKMQFAAACFSRVWPKPIHGFGCGSEDMVMAYPWHSTDATNWELGPCGFGRWQSFGKMSVRGSSQNLRAEVEHYLRLERQAQSRWSKEMAALNYKPELMAPGVRLGHSGHGSTRQKVNLSQKISVRLSVMPTGQELKGLAPHKKGGS